MSELTNTPTHVPMPTPEDNPVITTADDKSTGGKNNGKKVFIKTFGCQMNVYDTERMEDALAQDGYTSTDVMEDADLVLLNTCHIREKAAEKVYSDIGRVNKVKIKRAKKGLKTTLGVTGCVAQAEGKEIMHRAPIVNLVAGPQTYHNLSRMVEEAESGKRVVETEFEIEEKFAKLKTPTRKQIIARGVAAFLTVQEGCDKFCTFCVVPYTRGAEVSRSVDQIIEEAHRLVDAGVGEVTLLGQNVNAWHGAKNGKEWRLGELLYKLSEIEGLKRLRYTTSHPIDMDDVLIEAHGKIDKLMPYLHLPVQSGSDKILKSMNRHHTSAEYMDVIKRVRKVRPDMAISGDFIVGFPGESDEDFEQTMDLIREVGYSSTYSFKYSERPGTPGAEMDNKVPESIKAERLLRLQALLREQLIDFNQNCVGKEMDILIEKKGRDAGQIVGRSPWLQAVVIDGDMSEVGNIVRVKPKSANAAALMADRIKS